MSGGTTGSRTLPHQMADYPRRPSAQKENYHTACTVSHTHFKKNLLQHPILTGLPLAFLCTTKINNKNQV